MLPLYRMGVRIRQKEDILQELKFTGTISKGIKPFHLILPVLINRMFIQAAGLPGRHRMTENIANTYIYL
jgi:hypothetical protein